MSPSEKTTAFPTTARTWIRSRLVEGHDPEAVNRYLMSVYAEPLAVYLRGTPYRTLGESSELIEGFFADRLGRAGYVEAWSRSGLRLRRWLMNGFSFYLKETARRRSRDASAARLPEELPDPQRSPEEVVDRAFALSVVRAALAETRAACAERGLERHFEVFYEHEALGSSHRRIASSRGLTPERSRVMARTARNAFRASLRRVLVRDGSRPEQIEREIQGLLEVLG